MIPDMWTCQYRNSVLRKVMRRTPAVKEVVTDEAEPSEAMQACRITRTLEVQVGVVTVGRQHTESTYVKAENNCTTQRRSRIVCRSFGSIKRKSDDVINA